MISWMILSLVVGLAIILACSCFEVAARARRAPTRLLWTQAMALVVLLPSVVSRLAIPFGLPTIETAPVVQRLPLIEVLATGDRAVVASIDRWIVIAWVSLSALLLLRHAVALYRLSVVRRQWKQATIDGAIVELSAGTGPAVIGLRKPAIVVPAWFTTLPDDERRLILAHERQHIAEDDHGLLWWCRFLVVLVPWHPAMWYAARRLRLAVEQDCDARVLASGADAVAYADTLVNVAQRAQTNQPVLAPALLEPPSSLSRRITTMFAPPTRFPRVVAVAATTTGMSLLVLGCMTREPLGAKPVAPREPLIVTAVQSPSSAGGDSVFFEYQVQQPVRPVAGGKAPYYPDSLRAAGVEGQVLAEFIVDKDGKADMSTWKVLKASNEQFANAVRDALPSYQYEPARKDGRVVRQLVQQPFAFFLAKRQ